jgi:hypothetical protein
MQRHDKEQVTMPVSKEPVSVPETTSKPTSAKPRGRKKAATIERPVKYPSRTAEVRLVETGNPIDATLAKELLGWEELEDGVENYLLVDENGKKVQCVNNAHNRPFNETWARTLAQDILNGHWRDNGEAIVIGKSGQVLSAQHRLVGLVLADQMWRGKNAPHWKEKSSTPPVIESTLSLGVSEEPATIRTLDNVRPRTLSDVLYTEENVFGKLSAAARKEAIRNLDYAIRFLWNRTGQGNPSYGSFTSYRTHSESLDFFHRHPHLAQVVEHITGINEKPKMKDEDGKTITGPAPITQVAGSAGVAAGIEYLAGCSASDEDQVAAYHQAEPPAEKKGKKDLLDWTLLEKALAFFEELPQMEEIRAALASLPGLEGDLKVSQAVKVATIIKAWNHHCKEDLAFTAEDITPETVVDGFGNRILAESPTLGGIDDGDRSFKRPKKHDAEDSSSANTEEGEDEFPPDASEEDEEDSDEESNGVAGMTAPDLTEEELERRKDEQLAAREDKRQQLAENRKERQRARRRNEMAQAVARATVRDSKESLSESE